MYTRDRVNLELILTDLNSVNKRYTHAAKMAKTEDKEVMKELAVLDKVKPVLEEGLSAHTIEFTPKEEKAIKSPFLLTTRPVLYVANASKGEVADPDNNEYIQQVRNFVASENAEVVMISARIEEEVAELGPEEDKAEFLEAMSIEQSGLGQLICAAYDLLGLATYFAAGEQEVRAWTFRRGTKAPQAAGIIHSDFERGFIRVETVSYKGLDRYGNIQAAKEAGRICLEGKDYIVQDDDVMLFRFSV